METNVEGGVQVKETLGATVEAKVHKVEGVATIDLMEETHAILVGRQVTTAEVIRRKMPSENTVERLVIYSSSLSIRRMTLHASKETRCAQSFFLLSLMK